MIATSHNELLQSQSYLEELSEGLNSLFGENRIQLECDFKVLDDWRRDTDRMTTSIQMDEVNILRRFTPAQFLLKSAVNYLEFFLKIKLCYITNTNSM